MKLYYITYIGFFSIILKIPKWVNIFKKKPSTQHKPRNTYSVKKQTGNICLWKSEGGYLSMITPATRSVVFKGAHLVMNHR